jgi:hypothetical protein
MEFEVSFFEEDAVCGRHHSTASCGKQKRSLTRTMALLGSNGRRNNSVCRAQRESALDDGKKLWAYQGIKALESADSVHGQQHKTTQEECCYSAYSESGELLYRCCREASFFRRWVKKIVA